MKAELTLKDWLAKYYPTPANSKEARQDPIGHSLRKWRGLREKVLDRYGLTKTYDEIWADVFDNFYVDSVSCALCVKYMKDDDGSSEESRFAACEECPLFKVLGHPCDYGIGQDSPYKFWCTDVDPEPMIKALAKARQKYGQKVSK